jgi:LCP family protein required for cell wall assembly
VEDSSNEGQGQQGRPEYKVYRSRRGLGGLWPRGDLEGLRRRLRRRGERPPRERPDITPGRVLKWIGIAAGAWLLLSVLVFLLSAQIEGGVSDRAKRALSDEGNLFTGSTILVLGSDQRTGESIDDSQRGPARADTIMLLHASFGRVRKLSIPRDAEAQIPGHGSAKINAAYAIGGPALAIETVESFMGNGLHINHLIEIDFEDFPELIDALGGITVDSKTKICSPPFDNFWKGFRLKEGESHLDGTRALGYARVRKNDCAPQEDDRDRARRQQEVLSAMRGKLLSPTTFLRLPLVSWRAPKALQTDMRGPSLMALFADLTTGGTGDTEVLEANPAAGTDLFVSDGAKRDAVRKLTGEAG